MIRLWHRLLCRLGRHTWDFFSLYPADMSYRVHVRKCRYCPTLSGDDTGHGSYFYNMTHYRGEPADRASPGSLED